ncbi:sarcosine oxidase subunit gamma [Paracoccus gahaiensis]|uniref:Sarcosine oxidase subunit gamma n=1 Tax=Paracoccus gahaiensis TaxID=1706839 RepID=A0A4U0R8Q2_9RHOB|nr:sarcosine oxidase subunit gamma [Paracoccus gahaiensis]TJZ91367.1 sarcosine oxidase subunit gamma [Paracoccus gahaiensis]
MTDLTPTCAFGEPTPRTHRIGALTLTEDAGLGLASLALRRDAPAPDLTLPGPGEWAATGDVAVFWTGPGQWMVEYPGGADRDVAADLALRAPGCAVTEQTDGFVCIRITGAPPALEALLERLVNLDPRRCGPGTATRTGVHHLSVFVVRPAGDQLAILGPRSAAQTIWHGLDLAATRQARVA